MPKNVKLNLGCGYIGHPEWINIDYGVLALVNKIPLLKKLIFALKLAPASYNRPWPENLRLINLKNGLAFKENSIDYIFSAHFIEHLQKFEALKLLKSCHLSLKSKGTMRILVPDLDIVVGRYVESPDVLEKVESINNHFYGSSQEMIPPTLHQKILGLFVRGHRFLYNFGYLKKLLIMAGFEENNIVRCEFQQGEVPDLDFLDNHPDHSLFVEATK